MWIQIILQSGFDENYSLQLELKALKPVRDVKNQKNSSKLEKWLPKRAGSSFEANGILHSFNESKSFYKVDLMRITLCNLSWRLWNQLEMWKIKKKFLYNLRNGYQNELVVVVKQMQFYTISRLL